MRRLLKSIVLAMIGLNVSFAMATSNDELVYKALNVAAIPVPTAYPKAEYIKSVGGLSCSETLTNEVNGTTPIAPVYSCTLDNSFNSNAQAIFRAFDAKLLYPPTVYGVSEVIKSLGSLNCSRTQSINTTSGPAAISLSFSCHMQ